MASKAQYTGMTGVYLVAAELSRRGFIASPTSRSAQTCLSLTPRGDVRSRSKSRQTLTLLASGC